MTERRFKCTACGKCCYGWLPLTLEEALAQAGRFPLALSWTPFKQGSRSFDLATKIGVTVHLPNRKQVAVVIAPIAYIPPSLPCPALSSDNLCCIHAQKPLRCRAMPFYAYREESDQLDLLVARKDWACDTSGEAPVVYHDKKILDRADFDSEREALLAQAPKIRIYATQMLKQNAAIMSQLVKTSAAPLSGRFVVNFSPLLRFNRDFDLIAFANKQCPVLTSFAEKTAGIAELATYHAYYKEAAAELAWFQKQD